MELLPENIGSECDWLNEEFSINYQMPKLIPIEDQLVFELERAFIGFEDIIPKFFASLYSEYKSTLSIESNLKNCFISLSNGRAKNI